MARLTQVSVLAEAAVWRPREKYDASALIAADILTRAPLVQAPMAELDLQGLAYTGHGGTADQ
jgi:hypothetical protein